MTFKQSFLITFLLLLCLTAAFTGGYLVRDYQVKTTSDFPVLHEAYTLLSDHALNPLPTSPALEYGMIRGMLQAYGDPHTAFLEPVQYELETNSLQGKFGGIGVRMGADDQGFRVLYPFTDSPAAKAGIMEGDRLIKVDSLEVIPAISSDTIQAAIRGPVGESVTVEVARPPDFQTHTFKIKREEIALPSVTWHIDVLEPRLGVIEVNIIAQTTPQEIQKAADDLKSRGATALALDLRNNGGGLLDAGVETARLFLQEGVIIEQQYRGRGVDSYPVKNPGPLSNIPLVILVNQNTASAAEIIAGSIQAHGRGKLIGTTTYGKDTIQLVYELHDHSSLHVTTAHWWIPGWPLPRSGQGLEPDILVSTEASTLDLWVQAAAQSLFSSP